MKNILDQTKYPTSTYNEINRGNTQKILYLCLPLVFLHLYHIYKFRPIHELVNENVFLWKQGIFYSHILGLIAAIIFGLSAFILVKRKLCSSIYAKILHHSVVFFYLLLAVVIVGIDQRITATNAPFLLVSISLPAVSLLWPAASLFYNLMAYLFYYYTLGLLQNDPDLLLSLRVNGVTFSTIGVMVNFLIWKTTRDSIYQKELIENQKLELEKVNETKDRFFSIIAHDLKGPLGNINKGLEILEEEEIDDETKNELLKHIKQSAKNTFDLLDNLLNWALIQKGQFEVHLKNCKLNLIVEDSIELLKGLANDKKITISYQFSEEFEIFADERTVKTICRNIVSNAIKYTPIHGLITISIEKKSNYIELIIEDNGIGIEEDKINELFILGKNKSLPGTSGEKGTGLGLILCKEFIEKNNGYLTLNSTKGKGSIFKTGFPKAIDA